MTIDEAKNFFQSLTNKTESKSEIKIYKDFIMILNNLITRNFSAVDYQKIETELGRLNLKSSSKKSKRHYKKALMKFKNFLIKSYSLTVKKHYTNLYMSLGVSFGIVAGIVLGGSFERSTGIALGTSIGMMIGLLMGKTKDAKALDEGKVMQ